MGNNGSAPAPGAGVDVPKPAEAKSSCGKPKTNAQGKRICCVCKDTKSIRDDCIVRNGEERCQDFISAHNQCLRSEGFEVDEQRA